MVQAFSLIQYMIICLSRPSHCIHSLLLATATSSPRLHSLQRAPRFLPGRLKTGKVEEPHSQRLLTMLIIWLVLQRLQQRGFVSPGSAYNGEVDRPHVHLSETTSTMLLELHELQQDGRSPGSAKRAILARPHRHLAMTAGSKWEAQCQLRKLHPCLRKGVHKP